MTWLFEKISVHPSRLRTYSQSHQLMIYAFSDQNIAFSEPRGADGSTPSCAEKTPAPELSSIFQWSVKHIIAPSHKIPFLCSLHFLSKRISTSKFLSKSNNIRFLITATRDRLVPDGRMYTITPFSFIAHARPSKIFIKPKI